MEIIRGAGKGALGLGVDLLVHIAHKTRSEEKGIGVRLFDHSLVDGLLFADIMGNEELVKKAKSKKKPYVILNYFNRESKDNCIGINNQSAAKEVVDYLLKMGHRNIATITGKLNAQAGNGRLLGYKEALEAKRLKVNNSYILKGDWSKESGRKALDAILKLRPRPSAVFVAGDEMAIGLMEQARTRKINIPDELSVVGFDDIPLAASNLISLTTVRQPLYEVGRLGVKHLKNILEGTEKTPVKVLLDNTVIIGRRSVKSPA